MYNKDTKAQQLPWQQECLQHLWRNTILDKSEAANLMDCELKTWTAP